MNKILLSGIALCLITNVASANTTTSGDTLGLEERLEGLRVPENHVPDQISKEKLYAVHARHQNLSSAHELSMGASNNFTPDHFLSSQQLQMNYRFHFNNDWSLGLGGSYVLNRLSGTGERLLEGEGIVPDSAYTKFRGELLLGYHLLYGKFRLSMEKNLYFDLYGELGPGVAVMDQGSEIAAVADVGMVFWAGEKWSVRTGVKDYFHQEKRRKTKGWAHNILGHVDIGMVFGASK